MGIHLQAGTSRTGDADASVERRASPRPCTSSDAPALEAIGRSREGKSLPGPQDAGAAWLRHLLRDPTPDATSGRVSRFPCAAAARDLAPRKRSAGLPCDFLASLPHRLMPPMPPARCLLLVLPRRRENTGGDHGAAVSQEAIATGSVHRGGLRGLLLYDPATGCRGRRALANTLPYHLPPGIGWFDG